MVSGVVAYVDEHLGQEVMNLEKWYAALRHVREQITPILTRRRGRRPRRQHVQQEQHQK